MCEHLKSLEAELISRGIRETYRGQPWTKTCREWAYFECYLDVDAIRKRLALPACVVEHVNDDPKSGRERGLVCTIDHDAIMGMPDESARYPTIR